MRISDGIDGCARPDWFDGELRPDPSAPPAVELG